MFPHCSLMTTYNYRLVWGLGITKRAVPKELNVGSNPSLGVAEYPKTTVEAWKLGKNQTLWTLCCCQSQQPPNALLFSVVLIRPLKRTVMLSFQHHYSLGSWPLWCLKQGWPEHKLCGTTGSFGQVKCHWMASDSLSWSGMACHLLWKLRHCLPLSSQDTVLVCQTEVIHTHGVWWHFGQSENWDIT